MTTTTALAPPAVKVTGLRKAFGTRTVLDGIDLDIAQGSIFSLLGPNGAGKTTTVQILSTLLRRDAGEVHVAGLDLERESDAVRAAIGVTGQFSAVDNLLSSAFVPTRSMPEGVRWVAHYQPFTPVIETRRGLLMGSAIGDNAILAAVWCASLATLGNVWARPRYADNRSVA